MWWLTLDIWLDEVPAVNLWISSRTAFLCVYSLSSLSDSLTLTSSVIWNQPEKVKLNCPLFYLLKSFCMYRRWSHFSLHLLVKCIARIVGFLSPALHAFPTACIPLFYPLLFPAFLNPTPPLAGTLVCPSPFLGWWEELCSSLCPSPFSATCRGLCLHSTMVHFPCTVIPVNPSMPGTLSQGFLLLWGNSCLIHWPLQQWQSQLLGCEPDKEDTM